ncbi:DUF2848 domain-containing protein [Jiella sp. CQZ9-1]|uniref:DUF2848 domain-containing protein n=2 Tax=Jiella flava TaxID=2816857 RepID=A0A939FXI2_9HYPH|nr:DUF2848 domain-containing protein [Jiella flava]MBO0662581.1 DUF2848 domain-containing protein [Jiella flava]
MTFDVVGQGAVTVSLVNAVIAGWTGRDQAAVDHHIAELQAIGVAPPSCVPLFYRVGSELITQAKVIETVGATTSGEIEPLLLDDGETLYLGLGSDHTDRDLEAHSVALSKQVCPKPVATSLWRFDEVCDHLDQIELRSFVRDGDSSDWVAYQDGAMAKIRPLAELAARCPLAAGQTRLQAGTVMMSGTLGVLSGGVRPSRYFKMVMHDPILSRSITHAYECRALPVIN